MRNDSELMLILALVDKALRASQEDRFCDASMHLKQISHLAGVRARAIDEEVKRAMMAAHPFVFPVRGEA